MLSADPTAPVTEQAQETQRSEQTPVSTDQSVQELMQGQQFPSQTQQPDKLDQGELPEMTIQRARCVVAEDMAMQIILR